jgi:hypothetical protein
MATEPEGKIIMTNTTFAAASTTNTAIDTSFTAYFTFDHVGERILGSEFNFKMSGNPNKPQYNALMAAKAMQPTYQFAPIASTKKKVEKKQTYKGLSFELMMDYVEFKGNEVQKAEFQAIVDDDAAYPTIKSWFLDNFKRGFTVEKAKREIAEHKLNERKTKVRATVKVKMVKPAPAAVVEMPTASNF